jgi:hypothetical protein
MKHFPRRPSTWDGESTARMDVRSGPDPINPIRVQRLRRRGMTYRQIGVHIAREDGRQMPYCSHSVEKALRDFRRGYRDEDGERFDWKPATNRRPRAITLPSPSLGFTASIWPSLLYLR